ncbi:S8 family serine peptidase, partial [Bacillus sp. AFS041924]|uniref:S8 family serine peptidase n=1 Tax=Bacillus sp. AFS041924 TaxID=2033503 RepID=UPI000C0261E7
LGIDGTGIVVGSIDTGVQWDHPALKTKYRGYDPANPDNPNNEFNWFDATEANGSAPYDDLGHGTHTVGTMVGSEPNGTNKIGVAPGAKWIAVKAFTKDGGTNEDLIEAGEWMLAPKDKNGVPHPEMAPDVVNNSWGGGPEVDDWYRTIVTNWRAANIFPEFSAGNTTLYNPGGPGSIANPANYPESFATGATDINNNLANFSLRGPSPYGGILKPDISAPGVNIRSSVPGGKYEGGWNGTSMAGPHTSGLVALLLQTNSSLTVSEIERIIKETATP